MAKAMVITVGTGTAGADIVRPLVKTVKDTDPDFLVMLVSEASRDNAAKVAVAVGFGPDKHEVRVLRFPDDVKKTFQGSLDAMRMLVGKGYQPQQVVVDYTSGTKAMTAGVALAGAAFRCATLKYITGERRNGIVLPGTEQFLSIPPAGILAVSQVQAATELARKLRFDAAAQVLDGIPEGLLSQYDHELRGSLAHLVSAYRSWDLFNHKFFCGEYGAVRWDKTELAAFKLKDKAVLGRLVSMAKSLEDGRASPDVLADLFNNAERRKMEGRYDDAVARLYRMVEALAQWALLERHGISTGNVDLLAGLASRVPAQQIQRLESRRDRADGAIKIGLEESMGLLDALGDLVGKDFWAAKRLRAILKKRNNSILAHGFTPVSGEDCEALFGEVRRLAAVATLQFEGSCQALQFPWL
ncbi:MAG: TIGR02710 family CRISPR-associated protein [Chloroflexi bacterium]|nr:TIGR02710 family CRISPR-associated protein [Chloroflexota bacterium]